MFNLNYFLYNIVFNLKTKQKRRYRKYCKNCNIKIANWLFETSIL